MLSQTCDVVRSHEIRPYVQVAALVPVNAAGMERARSRADVRLAFIPALEGQMLVADLEFVATVDKEAVVSWPRETGCPTDDDKRTFAAAIARHRQRFAFPDDFNDLVRPVRKWIESKRRADSANGRLVRAIREIRVTCDDWSAPMSLVFWLYLSDKAPVADSREWDHAIDQLETKARHANYPNPTFRLVTYEDVSARDYVTADRLDLDGMSDA